MKKNLGAGTIAFPAPVYIVGTYGEDGEPNAMNAAWGGICSSEPPCVMVGIRKERYTYENIQKKKAFTVNFPDAAHAAEADYFGIISGRKAKKMETAGLNAKKGEFVDAPVIEEFPFALECKYVKEVEMGSHMMIIGEIVNMTAEESCLAENGKPDIEKVKPILYDPAGRKYHEIGKAAADAFSVGKKYL